MSSDLYIDAWGISEHIIVYFIAFVLAFYAVEYLIIKFLKNEDEEATWGKFLEANLYVGIVCILMFTLLNGLIIALICEIYYIVINSFSWQEIVTTIVIGIFSILIIIGNKYLLWKIFLEKK